MRPGKLNVGSTSKYTNEVQTRDLSISNRGELPIERPAR